MRAWSCRMWCVGLLKCLSSEVFCSQHRPDPVYLQEVSVDLLDIHAVTRTDELMCYCFVSVNGKILSAWSWMCFLLVAWGLWYLHRKLPLIWEIEAGRQAEGWSVADVVWWNLLCWQFLEATDAINLFVLNCPVTVMLSINTESRPTKPLEHKKVVFINFPASLESDVPEETSWRMHDIR